MYKFGGWEIAPKHDSMPQKVATAFASVGETLIGAKYDFVAYLASQTVNGTNHAVLAEQTVMNGEDSKNAVVMVFNEKPGTMDVSLVDIHRVVESGGKLGGLAIAMSQEIPEEAEAAFKAATEGTLGVTFKPFAYIGSKVVKGINYLLVAEATAVVKNPVTELVILTVNGMTKTFDVERLMDAPPVIAKGALGAPLGEWP